MSDTKNTTESKSAGSLSSDELIARLRSALAKDGDFPASAKVVSELRQLTNDPKTTANQITEVILREPSLGTRVLHLVNSSFYRRAKPIMTVSQAVVQIGMRPLAEMCSGLVLLQKFVPTARQGGTFANCLRKTVLTSLLASSLSQQTATLSPAGRGKNDEFGYLAGSFSELGTLLLAFYFPQLYDAAVKRAETKKVPVAQGIKELTGLSPYQLSMEVVDALNLPTFYRDLLAVADAGFAGGSAAPSPGAQGAAGPGLHPTGSVVSIAKAVAGSYQISSALVSGKTRQELDAVLTQVRAMTGIEAKVLGKLVGELPTIFKDHCVSLDLQLPSLPEFVATYATPEGEQAASATPATPATDQENQFNQFVLEIKQAVEGREPTSSIITSVMETLSFGLRFERVVLLLMTPSKNKLVGRLGLGELGALDPKSITRTLGAEAAPAAPDARAIREARPVFIGDPIIEKGWPFAVLPIGFGQRCVGVLYADRLSSSEELSPREQASVGILAELLDRSISIHA